MNHFYIRTPTYDMRHHIYHISVENGLKPAVADFNSFKHAQYIGHYSGFLCHIHNPTDEEVVDYDKYTSLIKLFKNKVIQIKLNNEYTAEVRQDSKKVIVGCQEFSFDKIDELYAAIHS